MASVDTVAANREVQERPLLDVAVFSATSFLSALLLFSVEPLFSKMVLPVLGGSAAVWSVAMVVFQSLLLGAYVYAWALASFVDLRKAAAVPPGAPDRGEPLPAHRHRVGIRARAPGRRRRLADRAVCRLHRPALFRGRGERAAAAGLVRQDGAGRQSLFSLSRVQSRLLRRPARLSRRDRTGFRAGGAVAAVEHRIHAARPRHRRLRRARPARRFARGTAQRSPGRGAGLARPRRLDGSRPHTVGPVGRGDGAYFHRRGLRAVPVDRAAGALSADLRSCVQRTPADPAQNGCWRSSPSRWRSSLCCSCGPRHSPGACRCSRT